MEPQQDQNNNPQSLKNSLSIPISIVVAGFLIAAAVWFRGTGNIDTSAQVGGKPIKVELGNLPVLGNEDAKITIIEFADFQCPYCEAFFTLVEPRLRDEYVKNGQAKVQWRDFAFLGPESVWAAEAARCANDQGKFWQYHDLLLNRQKGENQGAFSKENLKKFASELGLNSTDFDSCLDTGKYTKAVTDDTEYGRSLGVSGTPATFINGEMVVGVDRNNPFSQFKVVIDKYLK